MQYNVPTSFVSTNIDRLVIWRVDVKQSFEEVSCIFCETFKDLFWTML